VAFQLLFILLFCCPKFHRQKLELHFTMVLDVDYRGFEPMF